MINFANKSSWQWAPNMTVCDQQVLAPEEWPPKQRKNYINKKHSSFFPWCNLVSFFSDVMELSGSAFYLSTQTEINYNLSRPHVCHTSRKGKKITKSPSAHESQLLHHGSSRSHTLEILKMLLLKQQLVMKLQIRHS